MAAVYFFGWLLVVGLTMCGVVALWIRADQARIEKRPALEDNEVLFKSHVQQLTRVVVDMPESVWNDPEARIRTILTYMNKEGMRVTPEYVARIARAVNPAEHTALEQSFAQILEDHRAYGATRRELT